MRAGHASRAAREAVSKRRDSTSPRLPSATAKVVLSVARRAEGLAAALRPVRA